VPIYCYGDAFTSLPEDITIDNTQLFTIMKDYLLGNPLDVTDEVAPTLFALSYREIPEGELFSYRVPASDASDIGGYAVNDTVNFAIDSTGLITNATPLIAGLYGLNVSVWDVHDNSAFHEITIAILEVTTTTTTTTTTTDIPSNTTSITDLTNTTTPTTPGISFDPMMLAITAIGAAFVVIVVIVLIKRR
jgi:hypothetical protein